MAEPRRRTRRPVKRAHRAVRGVRAERRSRAKRPTAWKVFTNVGSLLVRLYLMKMVWYALYAQNAAPAGVPLHAIITYTTIALLMSLVLEIDGTRASSATGYARVRSRPT